MRSKARRGNVETAITSRVGIDQRRRLARWRGTTSSLPCSNAKNKERRQAWAIIRALGYCREELTQYHWTENSARYRGQRQRSVTLVGDVLLIVLGAGSTEAGCRRSRSTLASLFPAASQRGRRQKERGPRPEKKRHSTHETRSREDKSKRPIASRHQITDHYAHHSVQFC